MNVKHPYYLCQWCACNVRVNHLATCSCGKPPWTAREFMLLSMMEEIAKSNLTQTIVELYNQSRAQQTVRPDQTSSKDDDDDVCDLSIEPQAPLDAY